MGREARASTKPADWKKIIGRFHRDLVEATREIPNFNLHHPSEPTCIEAHA